MPESNKDNETGVLEQKMGNLITQIQELANSKDKNTAETKEKIDKLTDDVLKMEEKNQELVTKILEKDKKEKMVEEKLSDLERKLYLIPNSSDKEAKSVEIKAFEKAICHGKGLLDEQERKYLRTDSNPQGGFLAPFEYVAQIIKDQVEISPIRKIARLSTSSAPGKTTPKRTGLVESYWEGEAEETQESQSSYGDINTKLEKITTKVIVTLEQLHQSAFNMESEINSDVNLSRLKKEGAAFVNGIGPAGKRPTGFMQAEGITFIESGAAAAITMDSIIELTGELKKGYNPAYLFNRKTFAKLLTLKGEDQYYWTMGNIANGVPNMLVGHPYVLTPDMADIAANSYPVIFGDFSYYSITDHTDMIVLRDDYTLAGKGQVRFLFFSWVGGDVDVAEAFIKLKIADT